MDYAELVRKLGSLHGLLRELEKDGLYQGEHTIAFKALDGTQQLVHIYIDGTELQMCQTPGHSGLNFSSGISSE